MQRSIPFLDFYSLNKPFEEEFKAALSTIIEKKWYILGDSVKAFEATYAEFSDSKYSVGLANGLDALILSLKALGIGTGDEVIVPSNTYIASWLAVTLVGAVVVPVEPKIETCNIDPSKIAEKITKKTKAVMPVNLYGQAAELDNIRAICKEHNIFLIEDNAQAHGATCLNKATGSYGDINATSFYPGKNLGALGDGGAITTDSEEFAKRVKLLRNYGSEVKYKNEIIGHNSRLDELQAAFLSIKLKHLEEQNQQRIKKAGLYNSLLVNTGDIILPQLAEGCSSVYHIYQVRTQHRNLLQDHLTRNNIATMIHYPTPPHLQKAYAHLGYRSGDFPFAEEIANTTLSLPMDPFLAEEDIQYICASIKSFFN